VALLDRRSGEVRAAEGEEGKDFGAEVAWKGRGGAARAQREKGFVVGVEVNESEEDRGEGESEECLFRVDSGGVLQTS
jgi:hypothetical protein